MLNMEKLINQIRDAVIVTDLNSDIIEWNKGAEKQLGYTLNEVLGRPIYFLYPESKDNKFSQSELISLLEEKGELKFESIMTKKNGESIFVHTSLSSLTDDQNNITGIVSYTLDITKQKQNEEKLRQQAMLIDHIHDAVIVTDLDSIITQWNTGAQKQLGYTAEEAIGRPVYFLYPETKENTSQDEMISMLKKHGTITFEAPMRKKSGNEILVHTSLSPITDSNNNVTGVISYTLDVTEQRQAEETRREKERLENDLNIANQIQQSLLPSESFITEKFQIVGMNNAADQTGGDYFDWLELPGGNIAVSIADVTGHGIGPALIIAVCRAYFRASTSQQNDVNAIITQVNKLLTKDLTSGRFVTAAIGILDTKNDKMIFYSAGHAPTFFYEAHDDVVQQWGANDPPLGILENSATSQPRLIEFKPGDCLILITDGVYEWANRDGERYGIERLKKAIKEYQHRDAEEMLKMIYEEVLNFSGGAPQMDDVTLVIVKRCK